MSKLISEGFKVEVDKDGCKVNNARGVVVAKARRDIIPQGRSNKGFITFGDCPHWCVQANEDYIAWWSTILSHFHWRFFKENSCLSFKGQWRNIWKIQTIQGVGGERNWSQNQSATIWQRTRICVQEVWCISYGMWNSTTNKCAYSPQQNGVAEPANRTIMECARSLILAQRLGLEFWGEAVNTAVYIKNWCPTKVLDSKTPQEAWSGRKPDVSHLKVFGCKAFAHVPDEKRTKLESKSMPCVFLGYYEATKAYHLICVKTKRIIKSRDVVFIEGSKEIQ